MQFIAKTLSTGATLVNVTTQPLPFLVNGQVEVVPPSGLVVQVEVREEETGAGDGVVVVRRLPRSSKQSRRIVETIRAARPGALIVGTRSAAQAHPALVVAPLWLADGRHLRPDRFERF